MWDKRYANFGWQWRGQWSPWVFSSPCLFVFRGFYIQEFVHSFVPTRPCDCTRATISVSIPTGQLAIEMFHEFLYSLLRAHEKLALSTSVCPWRINQLSGSRVPCASECVMGYNMHTLDSNTFGLMEQRHPNSVYCDANNSSLSHSLPACDCPI